MKLHISFDTTDLARAHAVAEQLTEHVSSFTIGSLLLFSHGIKAVKDFRAAFPDAEIIVDSKITDRAKETSTLLIDAGADWITVMAGAPKEVIHSACATAHDKGKQVMIDLLDSCSLGQSALEAQSMGGDALLFHGPSDNAEDPIFLDNWNMVRNNSSLPIYVSANKSTVDNIIELDPTGIIIGKLVTDSENPVKQVQDILEEMSI